MGIKPEQPFAVTEFLKPGVEEFCSILPPALARRDPRVRRAHRNVRRAHWGMEVNTTSVSGFLRFSHARQAAPLPAAHLSLPGRAARRSRLGSSSSCARRRLSAELALEIAECARLIKGYGDTHKRGSDNYRADRSAGDRAGARRANSASPGHRCDRQRPHRGAARSRKAKPVEMPCRVVVAAGSRHRRRIGDETTSAQRREPAIAQFAPVLALP